MKKAVTTIFFIICCFQVRPLHSSRILFLAPICCKSYIGMNSRIVNGLLSHGHEVTYFNCFGKEESSKNYQSIPLTKLNIYADFINITQPNVWGGHFINLVNEIVEEEAKICDVVLSHPKMNEIISSQESQYDLIIAEMITVFCYLPLAEKFNIPLISVLPQNIININSVVGKPTMPSFIPTQFTGYGNEMNFFQRVHNSLAFLYVYASQSIHSSSKCNEIIQNYFGKDSKPVENLLHRISLVFYSTHHLILSAPLPPNVIEIGGVHIDEEKPLPHDIQKFIDESEDGVIYVSFGTLIKFSSLPKEKLEVFKNVFSVIPQRVLLRCDLPNVTQFSDNVMARNWFPQRDILAHENVRAFVSHGGLFGSLEAIHTATPIILFPFLFDQFTNARLLEKAGVCIVLDYKSLTEDKFLNAITNIIENEQYATTMREFSWEFRDRPMSPLDTAIYWIEYVIRHNGASHLTPISAQLPLYKYLLLDVLLFIIVLFALLSYILYFLTLKILTKIFKLSSTNSESNKKKQ